MCSTELMGFARLQDALQSLKTAIHEVEVVLRQAASRLRSGEQDRRGGSRDRVCEMQRHFAPGELANNKKSDKEI